MSSSNIFEARFATDKSVAAIPPLAGSGKIDSSAIRSPLNCLTLKTLDNMFLYEI